ncbi:MAG: YDG domain-containing protein [Lachnospiraceae bacterium]|nr:YDG domain-containing protein [Lachnospiraceae bacterium]
MRKILRQTLAIFLALAMLLGDNAIVYATESTDTSSSETAITEEADDGSETDAENAEDEKAVEDDDAGEDGTDASDETADINTVEEESKAKIEQSASDAGESSSMTEAAQAVQDMIDALPSVDSLDITDVDALNELYEQVQAADAAYQELSEEEQAEVDDSKLDELFSYINSWTEPVDTSSDTVTVEYEVTYHQTAARTILDMVNDFRTGEDAWYLDSNENQVSLVGTLSELQYDYELEAIAMQRAAELVLYYAHYRPDGERYDTAGSTYNITYLGENIALKASTTVLDEYQVAKDTYTAWLEADEAYSGQGHRRNMLGVNASGTNLQYTRIGIACVSYENCYFLVQEFSNGSVTAEETTANDSKTTVSVEVLNDSSYVTVNASDFSYSPSNYEMQARETKSLPEVSGGIKHTGKYSWTYWVEYIDVAISADAVDWSVSDETIASVSGNSLTALKAGETSLTATVFGENIEIPITVTSSASSGFTVTLAQDSYTYDGTAKEPDLEVSSNGVKLTAGTDYTVSYVDNVNAGEAKVTVTGTGDYEGEYCETAFEICAADISVCEVSDVDAMTYTGSALKPDITVKYGSKVLTADTDYILSCENNTNVGTATVTITGIGNYSGTVTENFTINPKTITAEITSADGTITKSYDGTTAAPDDIFISLTGVVDGDSVSAAAESYTYNSANVDEADTITASGITLSGTDAGNYTLSSDTATIAASITQAEAKITILDSYSTNQVYSGYYISEPTKDDLELSGVDYDDLKFSWYTDSAMSNLIYMPPSNVGTYYLKISAGETTNYTAAEAQLKVTITQYAIRVLVHSGGVTLVEQGFNTLDEAMAVINQLSIDPDPDAYNSLSFILYSDVALTGNVNLPSGYTNISFSTGFDEDDNWISAKLDFGSYTMTLTGNTELQVDTDIALVSSTRNGTLKLVKSGDGEPTVILEPKYRSNLTIVEGLKIEGSGILYLYESTAYYENDKGDKSEENIVDAEINVTGVRINSYTCGYRSWTFKQPVSAQYITIELFDESTKINFESSVSVSGSVTTRCLSDSGLSSFTGDGTVYMESLTMSQNSDSSSTLYICRTADVKIGTLNMSSCALMNYGKLEVGTLKQTAGAETWFGADSRTTVTESAVIYNTCICSYYSGNYKTAYFYMAEDADVKINGSFTQEEDCSVVLSYGILAEDDDKTAFTDDNGISVISPDSLTKLFTTNISSFPTEMITVNTEDTTHNTAYQKGTEVRVVPGGIEILAGSDPDSAKSLKTFYNWSEVATYLNTLSNTSQTYIVKIPEDTDAEGALTLPSKVGKLIFIGASEDGASVKLSWQGDLSLSTDLVFENIELDIRKTNSQTTAYNSIVKLNGKTLTLDGVALTTDFASITGTGSSALVLTGGSEISTTGTVTTVDMTLEEGSTLNAAGAVKVTGTLTMENGTLDCSNAVTLTNVISNSDLNRIAYGAAGKTYALTISGTVTADNSDMQKSVTLGDSGEIRKGAIDIVAYALAGSDAADYSGYVYSDTNKVNLLTAAKASSGWFVVGSSDDGTVRTGFKLLTYKADGKYIRCAQFDDMPVYLENTDEGGVVGAFSTLQEAFKEIDSLNDSSANYKITITADTLTETAASLTWPSKAQAVMICADGYSSSSAGTKATLVYKGALTLRCDVSLIGVELQPSNNKSINIGNYDLCIYDGGISGSYAGTVAVTGSGVSKASKLKLTRTSMSIGSLTNIQDLVLLSSELVVNGTISVGNVESYVRTDDSNITTTYSDSTSSLTGVAAVTLDKTGAATKVTPSITISGKIYGENGGEFGTDQLWSETYKATDLTLCLQTSAGAMIDFSESVYESLRVTTGIWLAKATNADSESLALSSSSNTKNLTGTVIKTGGYLAWTTASVTAQLYVSEDGSQTKLADCLSFADAVTEINNRKTAADYTIKVSVGATSQDAPKALTMPTASYVKSLAIVSDVSGASSTTLYYTGNLTMTSDTTLSNISFEQMAKSGSAYVSADTAKSGYPSIVTVSTGGKALTIDGTVTFNTPINLTGASKGTLTIPKGASLRTLTNNVSTETAGDNESWLHGAVGSFAQITLGENVQLLISEYMASSTAKSATAAKLSGVASMTLDSGSSLCVGNSDAGTYSTSASATITSLDLQGGSLKVMGSLTLGSVTLAGASPAITATKDFNITGKVVSETNSAVLSTWQKPTSKGTVQEPYLNVKGSVELDDAANKIQVAVYANGDMTAPTTLKMEADNSTKSAQLLTATSASTDCFVPYATNVNNKGEYPSATDGYVLLKSGMAITVYYVEDAQVALYVCEDDGAKQTLVSYYTSFANAVTAINTRRQKNTEYKIVLLQDVGAEQEPVTLTLPQANTAAKVAIEGVTTKSEDGSSTTTGIYFSNKVTMNTATEFKDVVLKGMTWNDYRGLYIDSLEYIATNGYDLTLNGLTDGMLSYYFGAITGKGKETITIKNGVTFYMMGSLKNIDKLIVDGTSRVSIGGSYDLQVNNVILESDAGLYSANDIKVSTLEMGEGSSALADGETVIGVLKMAGGAELSGCENITITDIENNGAEPNRITRDYTAYGREGIITIKGSVSGDNTNPVILNEEAYSPEMDGSDDPYDLVFFCLQEFTQSSLSFDSSKKLVTIEKESLDAFEIQLYGVEMTDAAIDEYIQTGMKTQWPHYTWVDGEQTLSYTEYTYIDDYHEIYGFEDSGYQLFKSGSDVYLVNTNILDSMENCVILNSTVDGTTTTLGSYVDFSQAVAEINRLKNASADYTIVLQGNIEDVCLTDKVAVSALTLPSKNMAKSLTISGTTANGGSASLAIKDNLTYTGELHLEGISLTVPGTTTVTTLYLEDTDLITVSKATITNLQLETTSNAEWDALGVTTVTNVTSVSDTGTYYTLASKQNASAVPQFTISGTMSGKLNWKVLTSTATKDTLTSVSDLAGVKLVKAIKVPAEQFVVAGLDSTYLPFKDTSGYVYYNEAGQAAVKLSYDETTTYAESITSAVSLINSLSNKTDYTVQFLNTGDVWTKDGNDGYGALTLPTTAKANSLTIKGAGDSGAEAETVLGYTGTLKPSVDLTFENITLAEGKYQNKQFTDSECVTIAFGSYSTTLTFAADAGVSANTFSSVTGTKGTLVLKAHDVTVNGNVSLLTLQNSGSADASLTATGTVTITNVDAGTTTLKITTPKALTLTQVNGGNVELHSMFNKSNQTQLKISGVIDSSATVKIVPYAYNAQEEMTTAMTTDEASAMFVSAAETTPAATKKLAVLTKASPDRITIGLSNATDDFTYQLTKYASGLYMVDATTQMLVQVTGYGDDATYATANKNYQAKFLSWANAVSEINSIGDKDAYYKIELLGNLGVNVVTDKETINEVLSEYGGSWLTEDSEFWELAPLTTVAMPSKAAEVIVTSGITDSEGNTESAMVFFTPTTLTLGCNTVFENIGLFAVKKYTYYGESYYWNNSYSINAGSYNLTEKGMINIADFYYSDAPYVINGDYYYSGTRSAITGSAKGSYTFELEENYELYCYATPTTKISGFGIVNFNSKGDYTTEIDVPGGITGVGTLNLAEYTSLCTEDKALSVKYLTMDTRSILTAKSVSVTVEGNLAESSNIFCENGSFAAKNLLMTNAYISAMGASISADAVLNGSSLDCGSGVFTAKTLTLTNSSINNAKNVTVTGTTTLNGGTITAGTETVGDGKLSLASVVIGADGNTLVAKQDKNGSSLLSISGTVTAAEGYTKTDDSLVIGLRYNDDSAAVTLHSGLVLLTAAKADSSWFVYYYNGDEYDNVRIADYVSVSGKQIKYVA